MGSFLATSKGQGSEMRQRLMMLVMAMREMDRILESVRQRELQLRFLDESLRRYEEVPAKWERLVGKPFLAPSKKVPPFVTPMGPHGAAPRKGHRADVCEDVASQTKRHEGCSADVWEDVVSQRKRHEGCRAADWGDAAPLKCREEGRSANKQEDDEFYEDALPPVLDLRLSKTMAVIKDLRDFKKEYRLGKCIGRGGYSAVYKGIRKADKLQVAFKCVWRKQVMEWVQEDTDPEPIPRELAHLRRVCEAPSCPAIISLLDWLRDSSRIVLVMELPEPCVNLFQFIRQCGGALEEDQARRIFQQVLVAVRHCHARGVFHRDLKTLNILIQTSTEKAKVIDFGSSSSFHDGHYQSFHGTLCLAPPECVQEKGYRAVPTTVWSLGVMLYHMVSGGKTINLPQDPSRGEQPYARPVSAECRDLIQKCLAVSPEQRPTIEEIACHVWLRRDHPGGNSP